MIFVKLYSDKLVGVEIVRGRIFPRPAYPLEGNQKNKRRVLKMGKELTKAQKELLELLKNDEKYIIHYDDVTARVSLYYDGERVKTIRFNVYLGICFLLKDIPNGFSTIRYLTIKDNVDLAPKKKEKTYKIQISGRRESVVEGTLDYLNEYFGYTLEIGHSWNPKIVLRPKTITSFVSNLQRAYGEKEACCYNRTFVHLVK